jgi:thioredoxin-related protein
MCIKYLFLPLFFLIATNANAQNWERNFDTAKSLAVEQNKEILLVFQGTDWCAPCIRLETEIWSSKTFQELAEDEFVLLLAEFPRFDRNKLSEEQKAHNNRLAEKYNPNGFFPFVVVLDKNGAVLGETGYEKLSPREYFENLMTYVNR